MALPSLTLAWEGRINQTVAAQGTALATNKRIVRTIKDSLILTTSWVDATGAATTPTNMWSTRYSCNASVAGSAGDGVDRWSADSDISWANAGVAHSWFVLRNTAIDTNCELLISCESSSATGSILTLVLSPSAGFTGGSTTARPTATDEIVALSAATWGGIGASDGSGVIQVWKSTDGTQWRVRVYKGGVCLTTWIFGQLANCPWTHKAYVYAGGSTTQDSGTQALLTATTAFNFRGASSATGGLAVPGVAGTRMTSTATAANDGSAEWDVSTPAGVFSATAANRGLAGYIPDLYSISESRTVGDRAPGSGALGQFAVTGLGTLDPWFQSAFTTS